MQIVIDIPDNKYQWIKDNPLTYDNEYCEAIRKGTPLPKGHGRLIDADMLLAEADELKMSPWYNNDVNGSYAVRKDAVAMVEDLCVKMAPTIIEADLPDTDAGNNDRNCEACKHHHDGGCDSWECEEEAEG